MEEEEIKHLITLKPGWVHIITDDNEIMFKLNDLLFFRYDENQYDPNVKIAFYVNSKLYNFDLNRRSLGNLEKHEFDLIVGSIVNEIRPLNRFNNLVWVEIEEAEDRQLLLINKYNLRSTLFEKYGAEGNTLFKINQVFCYQFKTLASMQKFKFKLTEEIFCKKEKNSKPPSKKRIK